MQNTKGSLAQQLAEAKASEEKQKTLNNMIDAAAKCLVDGNSKHAAQAIQELAYYCKQSQELFTHVRKMVISIAIAQSDELFILEKLKIAEEDLRDVRRKIIN